MDTIIGAFADATATSQLFLSLLSIVLKGAFILALTGLIVHFLRGSAATLRHLVWTCGIVAVLILPVFVFVLPGWNVPIVPQRLAQLATSGLTTTSAPAIPLVAQNDNRNREASDAQAYVFESGSGASVTVRNRANDELLAGSAVQAPAASALASDAVPVGSIRSVLTNLASLSWIAWALFIWIVGTVILLGRLVIAHLGVAGLVKRSDRLDDDDWQLGLERAANQLGLNAHVRLRQSDWLSVPISVCVRRPTIVLPAHAHEWDEQTRQTVLLHELAHVRRRDCLIQLLVEFTRSLYWVNPMVWVAAYHMKLERERACDDAVIVSGTAPSSYAKALLDIARAMTDREISGAAVMAMAEKSHLESRLLDILDTNPKLRTVNRAAAILSAAVIVSFALPVSILHLAIASERPASSTAEVDYQRLERDMAAKAKDARARAYDTYEVESTTKGKGKDTYVYSYSTDNGNQHRVVVESPRHGKVHTFFEHEVDEVDRAIAELSERINGLESMLELPIFDNTNENSHVKSASGSNSWKNVRDKVKSNTSWSASPTMRTTSLSVDQIIKLKKYGIDGEYLQILRSAGFGDMNFDELLSLGRLGVDADCFVKVVEITEHRYSTDEIVRLYKNGVDFDYLESLSRGGLLSSLSANEVVELARNGIDADYVVEMRNAGYDSARAKDLVLLRNNGVDDDLIRSLKRYGFEFSAKGLAKLSMNGVGEDLVRAVGRAGFDFDAKDFELLARSGVNEDLVAAIAEFKVQGATAAAIAELSRNGLDEECLADMLDAAGDRFTLKELGELARHGVHADFLRELSERDQLDLEVGALIELSNSGVSFNKNKSKSSSTWIGTRVP